MNNDIPRDMKNTYVNVQKNAPAFSSCNSNIQNEEAAEERQMSYEFDMEKSMSYMLGKMQVDSKKSSQKSDSSISDSVEKILTNPDFVQSHVDFCDELIQRGYSLEDAIEKTDMFFDALKSADIYN